MILPQPTGTESAVSGDIGIFSDVLAGVFQLPSWINGIFGCVCSNISE